MKADEDDLDGLNYLEGKTMNYINHKAMEGTIEAHKAGSHQGKGWEELTDAAIQALNLKREKIVFMLWGSYAQRKGKYIDRRKHLVLQAVHPSPLSAYRGFIGCGHFSKANNYLQQHGQTPIAW